MNERGRSLAELMVAVAIGALVVMVAAPAFNNLLRQGRVQGTVRQFTGDVRGARARAASTGWEYRIVGFRAGTGSNANQYRLLARKSSSVAWPADTIAPFQSSTQYAGNWTDVAKLYPGVRLSPGGVTTDLRFELTFAPRGIVTASSGSFTPFTVLGQGGATKAFRISSLGNVTLE